MGGGGIFQQCCWPNLGPFCYMNFWGFEGGGSAFTKTPEPILYTPMSWNVKIICVYNMNYLITLKIREYMSY